MVMTDKEIYRILCGVELSIPVYSRDWWLDCVCGDKWEVFLYMNGSVVEAAMLVYVPCEGVIMMPPYSQTLGVWFNPVFEDARYSKELYRKRFICDYFISRLPRVRSFSINFHYSFTDWLPFYWRGFSQTTRYTYVFPSISNLDEMDLGLNDNVKRNRRKAKERYGLEVKRGVSADVFLKVNSQTYERQGRRMYCPDVLRDLIDVSCKRSQGDIWGAYDGEGRLHAAVFIVWQEGCAYYIAGGADPELRKSGAHALVMWEAICDVAKVSSSFDFEGSMIEGVERFFREFGAIQMPYFVLSKGRGRITDRIRSFLKRRFVP